MNNTDHDFPLSPSPLPRQRYLQVVHAALKAQRHRFARQAILGWLAAYPGDLGAGLYYAQALMGETRFQQARLVLEGLCRADPEYLEAAEIWLVVQGQATDAAFASYLFALTGRTLEQVAPQPWGKSLWNARLSLRQNDFLLAEDWIRQALSADPPSPLAAVTHLQFLQAGRSIPLTVRLDLAQRYSSRWPDCVACMLYLADWSMEVGDSTQAVALLHQAVSRDVTGQVVRRLWGEAHPYRRLWPDHQELALTLPVPGEVTAVLGWNRLAAGEPDPLKEEFEASEELEIPVPTPVILDESEDWTAPVDLEKQTPLVETVGIPLQAIADILPDVLIEAPPEGIQETGEPAPLIFVREKASARVMPEELVEVQADLKRLADRLKIPGQLDFEGRYPVYVVLSMRCRLEEVYGVKIADILVTELKRLVMAVQGRRGWGARLFFADDASCTTTLGIRPAKPGDAWSIKLALADLDAILAKRGEMVGAVLIVGGAEIVPFHRLPNPVDDPDVDVLSDNPYGTRDENYFVPEWPVGRLPGGAGDDARLLLGEIKRACNQHMALQRNMAWYRRWWQGLTGWIDSNRNKKQPCFGYTAAIWKEASQAVFRMIGEPSTILVSPPLGLDPTAECEAEVDRMIGVGTNHNGHLGTPEPAGRLGYFNLHGLAEAPEWYGQRNPFDPTDAPDYPIALRPSDIQPGQRNGNGGIPLVVFCEACYGAHILDKSIDQAIALKFLESGSLAVIGSTGMAYGSIGAPLSAADLLGQAFWRCVQEGLPVGEALRQAKISLATEMGKRQDFLDGEDQKTLISFNLYGDPLAKPGATRANAKSFHRLLKPGMDMKMVCDRADALRDVYPVPLEVMASIRKAVAQYLPGMEDAQVSLAEEKGERCGQQCPCTNCGMRGKATRRSKASRRLVTLSKQVTSPEGMHPNYARLTLDEAGKLLKLVVSR
jgi:hypothetical protein